MASNVDAVRGAKKRTQKNEKRETNEERQARFVNFSLPLVYLHFSNDTLNRLAWQRASYRNRRAEQRDESRDGHQTTNQSERGRRLSRRRERYRVRRQNETDEERQARLL